MRRHESPSNILLNIVIPEICSDLFCCVVFHRALFTYEGNSNDIRLAEKGGELTSLSGLKPLNAAQLPNVQKNFLVSTRLQRRSKRTKHRMPCSRPPLLGREKTHSCTTDRRNHLMFPRSLPIRWRPGGAGGGVEQRKNHVCVLPSAGSKLRPA